MSIQERQLTIEEIQNVEGTDNAKRIMLSWLQHDTVVLYDEVGLTLTLLHPMFGVLGLLDLNTGDMATRTPEQGEAESKVSDELLLLARTVCGLND